MTGLVALAEKKPVLLVAVEVRGHERPRALETLAVETDGQTAVALLLDELVGAVVPDLDGAGPVVPLRDLALEGRVVEGMVLDVDGERTLAGLERHALRHGPRGESPVPLEPEVVVEPSRIVPLDDEDRRLRAAPPRAERLGRRLRVALSVVLAELVASGGVRAHARLLAVRQVWKRRQREKSRSVFSTQRGVDVRGRLLPASSRTRTLFNTGPSRGITLWTLWTASLRRSTEPTEIYA